MSKEYYPFRILLEIVHRDEVSPSVIAEAYALRFSQAGAGGVIAYSIQDMEEDSLPGTAVALLDAVANRGAEAGFFSMTFSDETQVECVRGEGGQSRWKIEARCSASRKPDATWMATMARVATGSVEIPGFERAILRRQPTWVKFVPEPPLARTNHIVTTTEQEVAERYEDPAYFWTIWDRVERVGDRRVCIRALDDVLEEDWLSRTYEQTMALARIAVPHRTHYNPPDWPEPFRAWWGIGSPHDELGGHRALSLVGYDATTKTVELAGFVLDHDPRRDEESARHVHIREVYEVRQVVKEKQFEGKPVDVVRIVFPFEWMARQERRPLLDAGAKVFYMDTKTGALAELTT